MVDHETLEIACAQHPDPATGDPKTDGVITITGCLAALGVSAYVGLAALGVRQVRARLDACAQCPLAPLQPQIEATIREANDLLQATGAKQTAAAATLVARPKRRPVYSVKNPPVSRRGFFQALRQGARDFLPSLEVTSERRRLVDAARSLAAQRLALGDLERPVPGSSFASFTVSDACTACTTCARICPTGALEFARSDTEFQVSFSPAACVNCGLCVKFCDPKALQPGGAPTIGALISPEPVVLHSGTLTRCRKCHVPFAGKPGDTLCPVCAFRQQHPFGATRGFGAAPKPVPETKPRIES
jgi:ferredoxin